jgi:N-acetyl sugar amidotransferase
MDTSDPLISFDGDGICGYCRAYDERAARFALEPGVARERLDQLAERIRKRGRGREYDCVIGVSGGVDSTYTALVVRDLGLRPLAVHLDNGWDSIVAVENIGKALHALGIDLYTHVLDWEEFRDLQVAFLRASTPDSEIPTDHAIATLMFREATRAGGGVLITGYNYRTESHHSAAWSTGHYDWRYIRSVHRAHGRVPLRTFPHMGLWRYRHYLRTVETYDILNYINYSKTRAMDELERRLGWRYYGGKHHESIYTRFYQGYILPRKFGFDKRRSHLSSLICAGEITREQALQELARPAYPLEQQEEDRVYVLKKLRLTPEAFAEILATPSRSFKDYPSYAGLYGTPLFDTARAFLRVADFVTRVLRRRLRPMSSGAAPRRS